MGFAHARSSPSARQARLARAGPPEPRLDSSTWPRSVGPHLASGGASEPRLVDVAERRRGSLLGALLLASCLVTGCGLRNTELDILAPETCGAPAPDGGTRPEPECLLSGTRSLETVLERVDGTRLAAECMNVQGELCGYEDLSGFVFLRRTQATDGVEILVRGWSEPGCRGALTLTCESFGEGVTDLEQADSVPLWCDCPRLGR